MWDKVNVTLVHSSHLSEVSSRRHPEPGPCVAHRITHSWAVQSKWDLNKGISSNYACQNCCPDSFDSGWVDPGGGFGFVGDWWNFTAREQTANCYGSLMAPFSVWPSWESANGQTALVRSNWIKYLRTKNK